MKQSIRITEDSFFKGQYSGSGDLELYGSFEGSLYIKNLYIKKSGIFIGNISAENIIVEGEMNADIQTENLYLKPKAGVTSISSKTEGSLGAIKLTTVDFVVHNKKDFAKLFLNDSHRFVRLKAQEMCS